jgi:demethylmenaquinone methyltransferase/2-methoxy-6-polyprenyl-1,4-benzoquinol methylase
LGSFSLKVHRMTSDRFEPHASRAMASMFDGVSARYDLLNQLMSLGQDGAWREAMARGVPEEARVVLDLCTGSGSSLAGLRRPGRTVLGVDVSFGMLEVACRAQGTAGWAPRLACADGFRLPLRDGALDAVTIAFGIRNLRPRDASLGELARVLRPGGVLAVLEATAPEPGPLRPFLAFYVRHLIPLLGRLSPDPSAYRYLSESIFEFGSGPEFERDLAGAGFTVVDRQAFLLGATRLWVARRSAALGQNHAAAAQVVHFARAESGAIAHPGEAGGSWLGAPQAWLAAQAGISFALFATLAWAGVTWSKVNGDLPLNSMQRSFGWFLIVFGLVVFGMRSLWFGLRLLAGARGRRG